MDNEISGSSQSTLLKKKLKDRRSKEENDDYNDGASSSKLKIVSTDNIPVSIPNGKIVAAHYNEIKEKNTEKRKSSKIFHMRNLNNWIKTELINEYYSKIKNRRKFRDTLRVLDLCCGKGGDLLKWRNKIDYLIATDIAEVSIGHCKERYDILRRQSQNNPQSSLFLAEFFVCDATKEDIRKYFHNPSYKVQLTSCQFAFHYCFESFEQANVMIKNASSCLEEGGYFICTIPDANEIMRRLRNSEDDQSFGNSCYSITFNCDINPPPLFGAKYLFKLDDVVDCPEFLVHFPTMVKLCRRHGLELVRSNSFVEYFNEKRDSGQMLLNRMNCFKEIDTKSIDVHNKEYEHVFEYKQQHQGDEEVLTLSKYEWEAFCLYKVCVFQKGKTIIGKNGEVEYLFPDDDNQNMHSTTSQQ